MPMAESGARRTLAVVSAGLRQPSSTRLLADRLAEATVEALAARGERVDVHVVELREHAHDVTNMLLTGFASAGLREAIATVTSADAVIVVTPIFSGAYSGMFKNFFDVLDHGALAGTPVLLGATAGTARHSLALEHVVRPLFTYLRALTVPTAVFAATEDFGQVSGSTTQDGSPLADRVDRAAGELADLVVRRAPSGRRAPAGGPLELTVDFSDLLGDRG
jgi:FMN reductase